MDLSKQPDGEYFVDVPQQVLTPPSEWSKLSVNQLIDIKVYLQSKYWDFKDQPAIAKLLAEKIALLEQFIQRNGQ